MRRLFTPQEINLLENNIYTYKITETTLKFTDDFREDFWRLYLTDMPVKDIFRTLGYDPDMLGEKRTDGFVYELRKKRLTNAQRHDSTSRTARVRRPPSDTKYSEMKSQEAIKAMEIELAYLRQEVDFLKKLYSLIPTQNTEVE